MSQSILLRGARQVLTLRGKPGVRRGPSSGDLGIIEDGSIFIQAGKIVSVGPTRRLENLKEVRGALIIPVHNCIVMPGFIDSSINLSAISTAPYRKGAPKRLKLSDFASQSLALLRDCLQHGTLNARVKAASGIHSLGADLSVLRQMAHIGNNVVGLRRTWRPEISITDALPSGVLYSSLETVMKRRLADSVEFNRHTLLDAVIQCRLPVNLDWTGGSVEQLKDLLQRVSPGSVLCHQNLSSAELELLAQAAATIIFSAGGSLIDRQPHSCVRDLLENGGAVALASGYDASNEPNFNMQLVLALAVKRLNLTIEQAIVATTINAAYAIDAGGEIGSLEPGKRAEVLVINLADYREIPRRLGINHVAMAIRNGEIAINRTRWRVGAA